MKASTPGSTPPKKNRWLIGCLVAAGVVIFVGGGAAGYLYNKYVDFGPVAEHIEADAKAYRAAGMPFEAKDLEPVIAKDQNAAPLLKQAEAECDKLNLAKETNEIQALLTAGSWDLAAKKLKPFDAPVAIAEKAAQRTGLDLNKDWDLGAMITFPELSSLKTLVRILCLNAQLFAGRNTPNQAVQYFQAASKLADLSGQESTLVGMANQIGCRRIILDGVQRCAATLKDKEPALKILEASLGKSGHQPDFVRAFRGEAYLGLAEIRNYRLTNEKTEKDEDPSKLSELDKLKLVRTGIPTDLQERGMAARHFQLWRQIKSALDKNPTEPEKVKPVIKKIEDDLEAHTTVTSILAVIMLPSLIDALTSVTDVEAETLTTRALLEAMQIKARTGKWPTKAEEIPGKWIDPFTDKPLQIKIEGDSFRIYSLGPNRKDDGGIRRSDILDESKKGDYDDVASYPPRKVRN